LSVNCVVLWTHVPSLGNVTTYHSWVNI